MANVGGDIGSTNDILERESKGTRRKSFMSRINCLDEKFPLGIVPSCNGVLEILSGMAVVAWRSGDDRGASPPAASFEDSFACSFHEPVSVIFRY